MIFVAASEQTPTRAGGSNPATGTPPASGRAGTMCVRPRSTCV